MAAITVAAAPSARGDLVHALARPAGPAELDALLDSLGDPPSYRTPAARPGHTRHYLPDLDHKKGEPGGTDLTLDPFLSVPRSDELLVRWDTDLPAGQRGTLAKLAELLPYVGRADSVCEARLLESAPEPDETWWRPGGEGDRRIRLLAPARPVDQARLEISTVEVRKAAPNPPAGSVLVDYASATAKLGECQVGKSPLSRQSGSPSPATRRCSSTQGILLADAMHRVAGDRLAAVDIDDARRRELLGTRRATSGHRHAHWIPGPGGRPSAGAAVSSFVLWAPGKLRAREVAAVIGLHELSGKSQPSGQTAVPMRFTAFPKCGLIFQAAGPVERVAPELCGPARRWRSLTPYLPVRHRKHEPLAGYLAADIGAELSYRDHFKDLPGPVVTPVETDGRMPDRWARRVPAVPDDRADEPVTAPGWACGWNLPTMSRVRLLLGQLSHFGYGIFVPEPDDAHGPAGSGAGADAQRVRLLPEVVLP